MSRVVVAALWALRRLKLSAGRMGEERHRARGL